MSRYVYAGSFGPPAERKYVDGRHKCDHALKAIFAAGPTTPGALMKQDRSDAGVNAALAKKLNRQERLRRSNSHEALQEIRKVHNRGARPHLDEAEGDPEFQSKSVSAIRKARERVLPVTGNRLLSVMEINKAFAARTTPARSSARSASDMHLSRDEFLRKRARGLSSAQWNSMTREQRRAYFSKGLGSARPRLNDVGVTDNYNHGAPESLNGQWNNVHADTGAVNDWRDIPVPSERPTIIGAQTTTTPSALTRDAAVDAIKRALRKPQKMWGNMSDRDDDTEDQDRTDDLDEDDADGDENASRAKNPNRDDSFDNRRSSKGKSRADEDEDDDEDEDE
jgi:hypothetical protein